MNDYKRIYAKTMTTLKLRLHKKSELLKENTVI